MGTTFRITMNIWKRNSEGEDLRQYLLGNLPEARQERLEKRLLTDSLINEELQATEDELIDEYLAKKLSDQERQRFESHFSVAEERRRKIRFGKTFRSYLESLRVADSQEEHKGSTSGKLFQNSPIFGGLLARNPVLIGSLIVVICLGTFVVCWLIYQRRNQTKVPGQTLAITLIAGASRSEGNSTQRLTRPPAGSTLKVELHMGAREYQTYQVELLRENRSLVTFKPLDAQPRNGHSVITVFVDASLLEGGDYSFKLSGISDSGQIEFRDNYRLRVNS